MAAAVKTILPGQTACVNLRKTNMAKNMAAADPLAAAPSKPRSKHGKLPTQAAAKPTVPGQRALTPKPYANGGNKKTQGRSPGFCVYWILMLENIMSVFKPEAERISISPYKQTGIFLLFWNRLSGPPDLLTYCQV